MLRYTQPDRFLFGTGEVAPPDQAKYTRIYIQYGPLCKLLGPEANRKVKLGNYERLFDEARRKVRSWESTHSTEKDGDLQDRSSHLH